MKNPIAKDLRTPKYRSRTVPNQKKEYILGNVQRLVKEFETCDYCPFSPPECPVCYCLDEMEDVNE